MQVACCQFEVVWCDKPANYRRVAEMVAGAKLEPGTLLLLPEMFATGFSMAAEEIAEPPDGPTVQVLGELARLHQIFIQAGVVVRDTAGGRPRNEAVVVGPVGNRIARYAKRHLFSLAGEDQFYAPGNGPESFGWQEAVCTPAICYDLRFPEHFRAEATFAAELIAVIACWPAAREAHWSALLTARAIENQCYAAGCNRCGSEPGGPAYSGCSQIIGPRGELLAEAGSGPTIIRATIDLDELQRYRAIFPALRDRRTG